MLVFRDRGHPSSDECVPQACWLGCFDLPCAEPVRAKDENASETVSSPVGGRLWSNKCPDGCTKCLENTRPLWQRTWPSKGWLLPPYYVRSFAQVSRKKRNKAPSDLFIWGPVPRRQWLCAAGSGLMRRQDVGGEALFSVSPYLGYMFQADQVVAWNGQAHVWHVANDRCGEWKR